MYINANNILWHGSGKSNSSVKINQLLTGRSKNVSLCQTLDSTNKSIHAHVLVHIGIYKCMEGRIMCFKAADTGGHCWNSKVATGGWSLKCL